MVIILDLSHPIAWLVRHVCFDNAEFSFAKEDRILMLFQTRTKLTGSINCNFSVTATTLEQRHFVRKRLILTSQMTINNQSIDGNVILQENDSVNLRLFEAFYIRKWKPEL